MALLRHVQHGRLGLRGFSRLPPLGSWSPPSTFKGAVFDRVTAFLKRFGSLALSLAALLPPPFPTSAFVLSAGATRYRFIAFVLSFGTGRACRFALLAYLASVFGRRSVARAWSAHTLVLLAAFGGVLVCIGLLSWLAFRKSEPHTPFGL